MLNNGDSVGRVDLVGCANDISIIPWWSALLLDKTRLPGWWVTRISWLNGRLYHISLYQVHFANEAPDLVGVLWLNGSVCIDMCQSNYHAIRATEAPWFNLKLILYYLCIVCYIDDIVHLLSCLINTIYEYYVDFYFGHVERKYLESMLLYSNIYQIRVSIQS